MLTIAFHISILFESWRKGHRRSIPGHKFSYAQLPSVLSVPFHGSYNVLGPLRDTQKSTVHHVRSLRPPTLLLRVDAGEMYSKILSADPKSKISKLKPSGTFEYIFPVLSWQPVHLRWYGLKAAVILVVRPLKLGLKITTICTETTACLRRCLRSKIEAVLQETPIFLLFLFLGISRICSAALTQINSAPHN